MVWLWEDRRGLKRLEARVWSRSFRSESRDSFGVNTTRLFFPGRRDLFFVFFVQVEHLLLRETWWVGSTSTTTLKRTQDD